MTTQPVTNLPVTHLPVMKLKPKPTQRTARELFDDLMESMGDLTWVQCKRCEHTRIEPDLEDPWCEFVKCVKCEEFFCRDCLAKKIKGWKATCPDCARDVSPRTAATNVRSSSPQAEQQPDTQ
jgi:hypothetical protein